jgi:hypothetical protein
MSRHLRRPFGLLALVALALTATLAVAGGAAADTPGTGHPMAENLVEIKVADRAAIDRLMADADGIGAEFNDHYLRENDDDGTLTVQVLGDDAQIEALRAMGYEILRTIEDEDTYWERIAERVRAIEAERNAVATAESGRSASLNRFGLRAGVAALALDSEITINRVDYFQNYAGRFLSVEAYNRDVVQAGTGAGTGRTMVLTWDEGPGTELGTGGPRTMSAYTDPDPTLTTYLYHRILVRIGAPNTTNPPRPSRVRVASSSGAFEEANVNTWIGTALPPHADGFLMGFHNRYMDPTEIYERFDQLATEFPNISQLISTPYKTNGYQRKAMANMQGTTAIGNTPSGGAAGQSQTVVLISRAWGHQGGNNVTAEFVNPGVADSPLMVSVIGSDIRVSLATNDTGALSSTAAQVVDAINAHPAASALVKALTYRGNAGAGIVQPRAKVNLSDFLTVSAAIPASGIPHDNSHVQRGPFQPKVMRIGKHRDGSKVGIYLFCQQHAREWVTPITCLETAERLLRNYGTDPTTTDLVNNLDIFILPSVNPDGAHHSFYNFQSQRRTMTNHCVHGAKHGDDPMSPDFWTPRANPGTGALYTNTDAASRTAWGVDLNRNQSEGTIWDGYVGASHSCTSDTYAGPGEVSEPEAKNEAWVVDVLGPNIKFSNNIHTSGGYFMWAPGAYKPTRETLPAPNIGIEKYFFAAAETVLGRIAEYRGNVVLPQRTGPIADVLYSAAGNSADDNWYRKGIIGYSFEAGADIFTTVTLTQPAAAGATGVRVSSTTGMAANDYITIGWNGDKPEVRRIASITNAANPNPNVLLQAPLEFDHASGEQVNGGTAQSGVGFFPNYANEGRHEANEFANGNYGLLEAALAYSRDSEAPLVRMTGERVSADGSPIRTTFEYVNEPSVIYYTLDNTTPTFDSPQWERQGLRRPGEVFEFTESTTVRWLALDLAGNTSTGIARFAIGDIWPFSGFGKPIKPGLNDQKAGSSVPITFSLGGDRGLGVISEIYSEGSSCGAGTTAAATKAVANKLKKAKKGKKLRRVAAPPPKPPKPPKGEEAFSALKYDKKKGEYHLDWKTDKDWKGTCRTLVLVLADNTEHTALFRFK